MLKLRMNSIIQQQTNNSNSNYCKMPDGTLIQWGRKQVTVSTSGGAFGYSGGVNVTFGIQFTESPAVITSVDNNAAFWNSGAVSIAKTGFFLTMAGDRQAEGSADWIAIGRWK